MICVLQPKSIKEENVLTAKTNEWGKELGIYLKYSQKTANWKGQFVKYKIISIAVSIKNFIFKETLRKSIRIISNLWV